jgi:hypothetical protein
MTGSTRRLASVAVALAVCAMVACSSDSTTPEPPPSRPTFKPLTTKQAVLYNIQLAYNQRNITQYDKLLDNGFMFYPSSRDVNAGSLPDQWGRAEEVLYNSRMFDPGYSGPNRCKSIDMDLQFERGVQWVEVVPNANPNETWYMTTVYYNFEIVVDPSTDFQPAPNSRAEFTVRNAGTNNAPAWRLAEMRDLGAPLPPGAQATSVAGVTPATWGKVKYLYQ